MSVFISYVREDSKYADYLARIIRENGLDVWLDRDAIQPGARWKDAIRRAIRDGSYFIALFSRNHTERQRSYANEELVQAIELLRQMPRDRQWLIPVKVDDCLIPDLPIGPAETLHDLNWVSLGEAYRKNILRLLQSLGVSHPKIDFGDPLAPGYGHYFDIPKGTLVYKENSLNTPLLQGLTFQISGGWVARQPDGKIAAQIITTAPFDTLQDVNVMLGLNRFLAVTDRPYISTSMDDLTVFITTRSFTLPRNTPMRDFATGNEITLPIDAQVSARSEARGALLENKFQGTFLATIDYNFPGQPISVDLDGHFDVDISE